MSAREPTPSPPSELREFLDALAVLLAQAVLSEFKEKSQ